MIRTSLVIATLFLTNQADQALGVPDLEIRLAALALGAERADKEASA